MIDVDALMADAVRHFWRTRQSQSDRQGSVSGVRDAGSRTAVTGGNTLMDLCGSSDESWMTRDCQTSVYIHFEEVQDAAGILPPSQGMGSCRRFWDHVGGSRRSEIAGRKFRQQLQQPSRRSIRQRNGLLVLVRKAHSSPRSVRGSATFLCWKKVTNRYVRLDL